MRPCLTMVAAGNPLTINVFITVISFKVISKSTKHVPLTTLYTTVPALTQSVLMVAFPEYGLTIPFPIKLVFNLVKLVLYTLITKNSGPQGPFIIDKYANQGGKSMDVSTIMQYVSYLLIAIGLMAFLVSAITQVIKSWPGLDKLPTQAVVIVLSLILCPAVFIALMAWLHHPIVWYTVFACMIAAFIVALVALDGWERVTEIWKRTKPPKTTE